MDGAATVLLKSVSSVFAAFSVAGEDAFSCFSGCSGLAPDTIAVVEDDVSTTVLLSADVLVTKEVQSGIRIKYMTTTNK